MQTANSVARDLKRLGMSAKAKASAWFFKTGKGQYGFGDIFYGVTVPEQRKIAKHYAELSAGEIIKLFRSKVHECRLTALFILVNQYKRGDAKKRLQIVQLYLAHRKYVNNWDLVDSSAPYILGDHFLGKNKKILYKLALSKNLWDKRIAIISTLAFIRADKYKDTIKISKLLLADEHDLIHKAVGWMLREVGNRSMKIETRFLDKYATVMPRTMLRYAIEKFPEVKRKHYLQK